VDEQLETKEATQSKRRTPSHGIVREIAFRYTDPPDCPEELRRASVIRSPEDVYRQFSWLFKDECREKFVVLCMNSANRPIAFWTVTTGTLNASLIHPREVFHAAIRTLAASVIVMHNHPSGNLEPSREDIQVTNQLKDAAKILDIPLHDHLIMTEDGFTSFAERGLI
jgi:DNA repair protein RadC